MSAFEAAFAMVDSPEDAATGYKGGHEPYTSGRLVGGAVLEASVYIVEEKWRRGQPLNQAERELMELAEEDLREGFAR